MIPLMYAMNMSKWRKINLTQITLPKKDTESDQYVFYSKALQNLYLSAWGSSQMSMGYARIKWATSFHKTGTSWNRRAIWTAIFGDTSHAALMHSRHNLSFIGIVFTHCWTMSWRTKSMDTVQNQRTVWGTKSWKNYCSFIFPPILLLFFLHWTGKRLNFPKIHAFIGVVLWESV